MQYFPLSNYFICQLAVICIFPPRDGFPVWVWVVGETIKLEVEGLYHFILCVLVRHEKGGGGFATVWILKDTIRKKLIVEFVDLESNHSKGVYVKVKVTVRVKKKDLKVPLICRTHAFSGCLERSKLMFDMIVNLNRGA